MRTIIYAYPNPVLDAVPLNEYLERISYDADGQMYLDGNPIERFSQGEVQVPDDATKEDIAAAVRAAEQERKAKQ